MLPRRLLLLRRLHLRHLHHLREVVLGRVVVVLLLLSLGVVLRGFGRER